MSAYSDSYSQSRHWHPTCSRDVWPRSGPQEPENESTARSDPRGVAGQSPERYRAPLVPPPECVDARGCNRASVRLGASGGEGGLCRGPQPSRPPRLECPLEPGEGGVSPGGHLVTTAIACTAVQVATGSAALAAGVAAGGFLIDLD